jgi:hypothetical protein
MHNNAPGALALCGDQTFSVECVEFAHNENTKMLCGALAHYENGHQSFVVHSLTARTGTNAIKTSELSETQSVGFWVYEDRNKTV